MYNCLECGKSGMTQAGWKNHYRLKHPSHNALSSDQSAIDKNIYESTFIHLLDYTTN